MRTDTIARLTTVLTSARSNPYSTFYRERFQRADVPQHISTLGEWARVPLMTKDDVLAVPYHERIFVDPAHVSAIRHTSGTTGGSVLFLPRSYDIPHTVVDHFPNEGITGILTFVHPQHYHEDRNKFRFPGVPIVCGHPPTMEHAVRHAAQTSVNFIYTHTFLVQPLVPLLIQYGLAERTILIGLVGELVTDTALRTLRDAMPHARIIAEYTSIETQGISGVAELTHVATMAECTYAPQPDYFWELVDPERGEVIDDVDREGEIIMTTLWTKENAFPLIRYRTGDRARMTVPHEDPWLRRFKVLGRITQGKIRIPGGEIRLEEVQRVIHKFPRVLDEDFELHFYEGSSTHLPQIVLRVIPRDTTDAAELAERLARELRIAPNRSYADGVASLQYAPLSCEFVEAFTRTTLKKVYFFRHER